MQQRLSVEANDVDRGPIDAMRLEKCLDGLGMQARQHVLSLGEHARSRGAVGQVHRFGQGLAQRRTFGVAVRAVEGRPEAKDALPVGLDQGDIDAVERGSAHETDRAQAPHVPLVPGLNRLPDLIHHRPEPFRTWD